MDHIGLTIHLEQGLEGGTAEEDVPLGIIIVSVHPTPAKVIFIVKQVELDSLVLYLLDATILPPPSQTHLKGGAQLDLRSKLLGDVPVLGQHHRHRNPLPLQFLGQGSDDVG